MSDVFKALAHPLRRRILRLLRERSLSAGEIAEAISAQFDVTKPTLSGHFNILKDAGLIHADREGTTIRYSINMSVMEDTISGLMDLVGTRSNEEDTP